MEFKDGMVCLLSSVNIQIDVARFVVFNDYKLIN